MDPDSDIGTAASRRVRKDICDPARTDTCAIWPSTHAAGAFATYSTIRWARARTGHGFSRVVSAALTGVAGRVEACRPCLRREQADDRELHPDHRLHVHGTAAVDVAVGQVCGERVVAPAVGGRRDDIEVRQQQQRRATRPVAVQPDVD